MKKGERAGPAHSFRRAGQGFRPGGHRVEEENAAGTVYVSGDVTGRGLGYGPTLALTVSQAPTLSCEHGFHAINWLDP